MKRLITHVVKRSYSLAQETSEALPPSMFSRGFQEHLPLNLYKTRLNKNTISPLRATSRKENTRRAAVLVPLCIVDNKPSLLFLVRSKNLRNHSGEVR